MSRFMVPALIIAVFVGFETFYRWANGLPLTWDVVAYRVGFLTLIFLASAWSSRRDARRGRSSDAGIVGGSLILLVSAGWTIVAGGRVITALQTGRIAVLSSTETDTLWAVNPGGFALTLGVYILGTAFGLLIVVACLFGIRNWIARRKGPAWP